MNLITNIIICLSLILATNLFSISAQANTQETDQTTILENINQNTNNNNVVAPSFEEQEKLNPTAFDPDTVYTDIEEN
ncbi:MAG: hypothetical protein HY094_01770 [Candidatus Melainabacteria bacterium]|nr:hypothetical protein [Candidatus Melainabacteria bacterium]